MDKITILEETTKGLFGQPKTIEIYDVSSACELLREETFKIIDDKQ